MRKKLDNRSLTFPSVRPVLIASVIIFLLGLFLPPVLAKRVFGPDFLGGIGTPAFVDGKKRWS